MDNRTWKSEKSHPRVMIAATGSGSGKTTVTCGLLRAFQRKGVHVVSFKCGPDYIDPMFHTEVLQIKSRNLDLFFTGEEMTKELFCVNAEGSQLAVIEGVMGFYDGLAGVSTLASSYDLARVTKTPVLLLVDCQGKSVSVLAEIKGFMELRLDSGICGVLLNRVSPMLYKDLKSLIEAELGIPVYGYMPMMPECSLESRHLGLVTATEIGNLQEILDRLATQAELSVDLDGLLQLAKKAVELDVCDTWNTPGKEKWAVGLDRKEKGFTVGKNPSKVSIAMAMDPAFCFYYQDNLELFEKLGGKLVPFSPLTDRELPIGIGGLILGGGYPELHLEQLSNNKSLMNDIRDKLAAGLPCLAECGGFMYLQQWIEDRNGTRYPMVGAITGGSFPTEKLSRFGYISLKATERSVLGEVGLELKGHEFHYWDSTHTGNVFHAQKPLRKRNWDCGIAQENLLAGYPHIHYYSNPQAAKNFVAACRTWSTKMEG